LARRLSLPSVDGPLPNPEGRLRFRPSRYKALNLRTSCMPPLGTIPLNARRLALYARRDGRFHRSLGPVFPSIVGGPINAGQGITPSCCITDPTGHGGTAHSITSSARKSNEVGTVRPSALTLFMLITSWNLVGCSTGRSEGLAPLRIYPRSRLHEKTYRQNRGL
jgi:hypothetical protein